MRLVNKQRILLFGQRESLAVSVLSLIEKQQIVIDQASGKEELWKIKADAGGILIIWEELLALWQWNIWQEESGDFFLEMQLQQGDKEGDLPVFWQWFRQLCQMQEIPVIVYLPQRADEIECECLRNGAAECVCRRQKPELQVYRIVRQVLNYVEQKSEIFGDGRVIIDKDRHVLEINGVAYRLSPREFVAFETLWNRKNNLVGREELSALIWEFNGKDKQRSLDMVIRSLRKKLSPTCFEIITVYGKGYYLRGKQ